MQIHYLVNLLVDKCGTNSPYIIAELLGIAIYRKPLGKTRGFYLMAYEVQMIILNKDLDDKAQLETCAHELGHALLHPLRVSAECGSGGGCCAVF